MSGASEKSSGCLNSRGSKPYAANAASNPASHHLCSGGARVIVLAGLVRASRSLRGRPDSRNLKLTHTPGFGPTVERLELVCYAFTANKYGQQGRPADGIGFKSNTEASSTVTTRSTWIRRDRRSRWPLLSRWRQCQQPESSRMASEGCLPRTCPGA